MSISEIISLIIAIITAIALVITTWAIFIQKKENEIERKINVYVAKMNIKKQEIFELARNLEIEKKEITLKNKETKGTTLKDSFEANFGTEKTRNALAAAERQYNSYTKKINELADILDKRNDDKNN